MLDFRIVVHDLMYACAGEYSLHGLSPDKIQILIEQIYVFIIFIFRAFELRQNGLSDTEIAQELDIPRTTLLSRMKKVTATLTEEFF